MALPTNRIRKIKLPDDNIYDIVPSTLTDGTTSYALTSPTLTSDSTIALTSDIPSTYLKSAGVGGTFNNTLTISKQDDTLVTFYNYFHSPTYSTGLSIASGRGVNDLYVPEASTNSSGVMSTSAQTFVGVKTFKSTVFTSYGAVMPDTSSYVANRTIATTDDIPSVLGTGASNKNKYLHTNASTGALEWSSVTGPTTYLVSASASGTTLTITPNSGSAVNFYNYYPSRSYTAGLQISTSQGITATCALYVPYANNAQAGVVSSDSQTFAGTKTFKTAASNSYGAVMPTTSSYTANKTIATTDLISSAEFVEVLPSTVTITFTESYSSYRTGLSIYDGSDDTGTLLYSIASGGSVTTPQTLTITSGNIFISTTGSRYSYISQGSTGGISNVVITNNGGRGVPVTLSADVSDNGTFTISLDYDY